MSKHQHGDPPRDQKRPGFGGSASVFMSKHTRVGREREIPRVTENVSALDGVDTRAFLWTCSAGLILHTLRIYALRSTWSLRAPSSRAAKNVPALGDQTTIPNNHQASRLPKRPGFGGSATKNVPALGDQLPKRPGFGGSRSSSPL